MTDALRHLCHRHGIDPETATAESVRDAMARDAVAVRAVTLAPTTIDREARSVEAVLATDDPVEVWDWERWEIADEILTMAGCRLKSVRGGKLPLLDSHQRGSARDVLGSVVDLRIDGGKLLGREIFSALSEPEFVKTAEGHLDQRSVGYRVYATTRIKPGESGSVNGKTFTARPNRGLNVVTDWEPLESSVVPIGADPAAGTRAAADTTKPAPSQETTMPQKPKTDNENHDEGREAPPAENAGRAATPPENPGPDQDALSKRLADLEKKVADSQRGSQIEAAFRPFAHIEGVEAVRAKAVEDGLTVDQARGRLLEHLQAATPSAGRAVITADERDKTRAAMAAAVACRAMDAVGRKPSDDEAKAAGHYRGLSLFDLAVESLVRSGASQVELRGMRRIDVVGAAFTGVLNGRTMAATGDFATILGASSHRVLLAGFAAAPQTWREWCYIQTVSDFKSVSLAQLSGFDVLTEVPEGGEIPQHSLSETAETIAAKSFGRIFAITRQAIINDDLGAFSRVPFMQGRAWGNTINRAAVTKLLSNPALADGKNLFSADHANYDQETDRLPDSIDDAKVALNTLRGKIRAQKGIADEDIYLEPEIVLAGTTYAANIAEAIGDTSTVDKARTPNRLIRNLRFVEEPSVENPSITGYNAGGIWMFANPTIAPVVVVALLDGVAEPRLESRQGWSVEGVEYKVVGDAGFGVADYRGAAYATGADA
ncbi:MAG: hypothetical protein GX595_14265 [Lentisphaerae bacterium]|nr:hypothetical protein [Lentisphaerota bacterium]